MEWKSPWFQLVLKQVSQCSQRLWTRGQNGLVLKWLPKPLAACYLFKNSSKKLISKIWHVIKAYIHLNAWKPQCEDVSGERCQRSCKLDRYALSHPKEQLWLSDRICSMQHHSMSTDGAATVACIMGTNTAIATVSNYLSEWWWCTSCAQKGQFQHS